MEGILTLSNDLLAIIANSAAKTIFLQCKMQNSPHQSAIKTLVTISDRAVLPVLEQCAIHRHLQRPFGVSKTLYA
jgi:hypothetical protein